ncbi:hypothetical protein [Oryzihumus leptocrescens]|uniref:Uncharacterized protein n=1 Tax=Oryzihumus leptocrescens TaxID=297536 RepID=A0A542ZH49_9MICO|nr:hypothetical protein [Oryzihumus leptocrescens]TQL59636.1 hypothetical protein FB474_0998 [Oryzihumus leptocrescens]
MNPTLDDLRHVLQDEAVASPAPSPDALVAGATARVQAARRRRAVLAGAAAVLVLAGGVLAGTHAGRKSSEPAHTGPFRVDATGGAFPAYSDGGKRLLVVTAPALDQLNGTIDVSTTPGRELTARILCKPDSIEDFDQRKIAKVTGPSRTPAQIHCLPSADVAMNDSVLGKAEGTHTPVDLDVFVNRREFSPGSGPSFAHATISIAIYESVPFAQFPKPSKPAEVDVLGDFVANTPKGAVVLRRPRTTAEANTATAFTVPYSPNLDLDISVHGPGRMKVTVNGVVVQDPFPNDSPNPPVDGFHEFTTWAYSGLTSPLDPRGTAAVAPLAKGTPMHVVLTPEGFTGPNWQVVVAPQE